MVLAHKYEVLNKYRMQVMKMEQYKLKKRMLAKERIEMIKEHIAEIHRSHGCGD